jgi:hypothetical protein
VKNLVADGLAAQMEVAVPMLRGPPRMHAAVMVPSLTADHPTVQNFVAQVCAAEPKVQPQRVKPEVETLPELHVPVPAAAPRVRGHLLTRCP